MLPTESQEDFEQLREQLFSEFAPETVIESLLVARLASVAWRLARIPQIEASAITGREDRLLFSEKSGALLFIEHGDGSSNLNRYETSLERSFFRTVEQLRALRAWRASQPTKELPNEPKRDVS